jgi:hypothetical protein
MTRGGNQLYRDLQQAAAKIRKRRSTKTIRSFLIGTLVLVAAIVSLYGVSQ